MPVLLYGVGTLIVAAGIAAIGFGIPNNEFGIGNTLIVAGVAAVGSGLIVIGLGVVVAQLQRIADALGTRAQVRTNRQFETFDPAAAGAQLHVSQARVAFPPRTKPDSQKPEGKQEMRPEPRQDSRPDFRPESRPDAHAEPGSRDPFAPEPRKETPASVFNDRPSDYFAPSLPNPDEPPETAADEVYLSPLQPAAPPPPAFFRTPDPSADRRGAAENTDRDEHEAPRPPHAFFDAMWPSEPKGAAQKPAVQKPADVHGPDVRRGEPGLGNAKLAGRPPSTDDLRETALSRQPDSGAKPADNANPRSVAILKSGVVDGMGYTLYVDGSIEAELPQGTLRFASINELRSHL